MITGSSNVIKGGKSSISEPKSKQNKASDWHLWKIRVNRNTSVSTVTLAYGMPVNEKGSVR